MRICVDLYHFMLSCSSCFYFQIGDGDWDILRFWGYGDYFGLLCLWDTQQKYDLYIMQWKEVYQCFGEFWDLWQSLCLYFQQVVSHFMIIDTYSVVYYLERGTWDNTKKAFVRADGTIRYIVLLWAIIDESVHFKAFSIPLGGALLQWLL